MSGMNGQVGFSKGRRNQLRGKVLEAGALLLFLLPLLSKTFRSGGKKNIHPVQQPCRLRGRCAPRVEEQWLADLSIFGLMLVGLWDFVLGFPLPLSHFSLTGGQDCLRDSDVPRAAEQFHSRIRI